MGLEDSYLKNACDVFQMDTYMYRCVSIIYFTPIYIAYLCNKSVIVLGILEKKKPQMSSGPTFHLYSRLSHPRSWGHSATVVSL